MQLQSRLAVSETENTSESVNSKERERERERAKPPGFVRFLEEVEPSLFNIVYISGTK